MDIKIGDWAAVNDGWRFEPRLVEAVTEKTVTAKPDTAGRAWRCDRKNVAYVGDKASVILLCQRLESSRNQEREDVAKAASRRRDRDAEFIAKATRPDPAGSEGK